MFTLIFTLVDFVQPSDATTICRKNLGTGAFPVRFRNAREDSRASATFLYLFFLRFPYLLLPRIGTSLRRLLLILRAVDSRSMERTVSKQPAIFRHAPLAVR